MPERIYLAGPLFMPYERKFLEETARRLRAEGHEVFVPHENPTPPPRTPKMVFDKDMTGLGPATVIVAVLDGREVDDGTACEIGIFWGLRQHDPTKKAILGLSTDFRHRAATPAQGVSINAFITGCIRSAGQVCYSVDEVVEELRKLQ